MSEAKPNIAIKVDLTNAGQFFACCGLLELADRLWPKAEVTGVFAPIHFERSQFCIFGRSPFTSSDLVKALLNCERLSVDPYQPIIGTNGKPVADAKKTKPVVFGEPLAIRLSWWLDEIAGRQTDFKMWAAHKTSEGLINEMAKEITLDGVSDATVLELRTGMSSRLGLDTRSSWNALDEGFSPNEQKLPVDTYPTTELLAAIGLETFRPAPSDQGYVFACWTCPLPTIIARAVASGRVRIKGTTRHRFEIGTRGRFKFFTKATLFERSTHG